MGYVSQFVHRNVSSMNIAIEVGIFVYHDYCDGNFLKNVINIVVAIFMKLVYLVSVFSIIKLNCHVQIKKIVQEMLLATLDFARKYIRKYVPRAASVVKGLYAWKTSVPRLALWMELVQMVQLKRAAIHIETAKRVNIATITFAQCLKKIFVGMITIVPLVRCVNITNAVCFKIKHFHLTFYVSARKMKIVTLKIVSNRKPDPHQN